MRPIFGFILPALLMCGSAHAQIVKNWPQRGDWRVFKFMEDGVEPVCFVQTDVAKLNGVDVMTNFVQSTGMGVHMTVEAPVGYLPDPETSRKPVIVTLPSHIAAKGSLTEGLGGRARARMEIMPPNDLKLRAALFQPSWQIVANGQTVSAKMVDPKGSQQDFMACLKEIQE